jgi:hypothetical protein
MCLRHGVHAMDVVLEMQERNADARCVVTLKPDQAEDAEGFAYHETEESVERSKRTRLHMKTSPRRADVVYISLAAALRKQPQQKIDESTSHGDTQSH